MRFLRFGLVAVAASVVAVGCGEGRAIFNVDVYSFLVGQVDTLPYGAFPPPAPAADSSTVPEKIHTLALGNSSVDTVRIIAGGNFLNGNTGRGDVAFQIFFSTDSSTTYAPANLKFDLSALDLALGETRLALDTINLVGDPTFMRDSLWVGILLRAQSDSATLTGRFALNQLRLRIVVRDQVF